MVSQSETPTHRADLAPADAAALRRWERLRAHGRSTFVWRNGVIGWGLPAAIVTALYKVVDAQGLAWPVTLSSGLRHALVVIALVFPALGYVFGGWLWTQGEARYARLRGEPRREAEGGAGG
ncbi:MAG TPA: hypothetical protein VF048_12185 [Gemmatimonadaceae bacterium]|jgi:hypothetical protein